jgi:hypothetical protein
VRGLGALMLFWALSTSAAGVDDDDAAALALSSVPLAQESATRALTATFEAAQTFAAQRGGEEADLQRLSVDAHLDTRLASGWRAVVAERIDVVWPGSFRGSDEVGTLKEAYIGWQPQADLLLDVGRINARQGVAFGYNPTDFLRADAIRSLVSLDPNSLRDNRLGTVMARGQFLWGSGAITAAYAPQIVERNSAAALDPDWGATNAHARWLLAISQQIAPGWSPQWLAFGEAGRAPQVGMNLTAALGTSTVAFLEISGGQSPSLLAQAISQPERDSFRSRAASGFTYSMANKLSLTFEYEYNGAGAGAARWSQLRMGSLPVYGRYREFALAQQDLPTRSNAFVYASWQDLVVQHLDLSAFVRADLIDHSRLPWWELRRHWTSVDLALRLQTVQGGNTSDYGASPQRKAWQLLFDYYL